MFEGFSPSRDGARGRRLALGAVSSVAFYVLVGAGLVVLAGSSRQVEAKKKVEVVFRPPPSPVVEAEPPPPPKPRPPPPRTLETKEVADLPPPAPLVAPQEIPLDKPEEAEPTGEPIAVAAAPAGGFGYSGAPPAPVPAPSEPIHLPESARPPEPVSSNPQPEYPEDARRRGLEGQVILRIVVGDDGRVGKVEVLRGEEPFVSEAVRAVRSWRYRPATLDGSAVAAYRVVRIPFRLKE
jgi:TonB family protein